MLLLVGQGSVHARKPPTQAVNHNEKSYIMIKITHYNLDVICRFIDSSIISGNYVLISYNDRRGCYTCLERKRLM